MSAFGRWTKRFDLPAFASGSELPRPDGGQRLMLGNRCIQVHACADGTVGLWDERYGCRWLTAPDPTGTGTSTIVMEDGSAWGTASGLWPPGPPPVRTFGPSWFEVACRRDDVELERLMLCPEGDSPWVLICVRVRNVGAGAVLLEHRERWAVVPRWVNLTGSPEQRASQALAAVRFNVEEAPRGLRAQEERTAAAAEIEQQRFPQVFGPPVRLVCEALGDTPVRPIHDGAVHPVLDLVSSLELGPGEEKTLWFRFGADDGSEVPDPAALLEGSLEGLRGRLARALSGDAPEAEQEVPWHAALLTGGACRDEVLGGHTLNQGSVYAYGFGGNAAARDPLQHALPLVYIEPDLALSVLRNTCSWASPDGDLPYALDGAKRPWTDVFQPSDGNLWALWLAAEYAAATGNLAAFEDPVVPHPVYDAPAVSLRENLQRQFRFFVEGVGTGEHGHVRMRNADWNDTAIELSGVARRVMIERGESVLNSAFAAWALPVYAGLCDRLGDEDVGRQARAYGEELRQRVAGEWNGRWFRRAYAPGKGPLGEDDCWLEVQPWAVLSGAADRAQARTLLTSIDRINREGSPLGARVRWPPPGGGDPMGRPGEGTAGGIWFSINMTLVWAAARVEPALAWDEWRRMTLAAHTAAYPDSWEGTLSGPDAYNAPESPRAGHTWEIPALPAISMQRFPVNNLHSHSGPLLAYLRLLGVEPDPDGQLRVGGGSAFASRVFAVDADGHGRLEATGAVRLRTRHGVVEGGPGILRW